MVWIEVLANDDCGKLRYKIVLIHRVARDTTKEWFQIEDREIQRKHHQMTVVESQPHDDLSSIQGITQSPSILNWPHDLRGLKAKLDLRLMMATWINILIFNQNMIVLNRSVILNRMSTFLFLTGLWGISGEKTRLCRKKNLTL